MCTIAAPLSESVSAGSAQHARPQEREPEKASHEGALFGAGRWRRGAGEGELAGGDDEEEILLGGTRWREASAMRNAVLRLPN